MAYSDEMSSIMRPTKKSRTISIPITFDYSGGRREYSRSRLIWAAVLSVVAIIVGVGTIFSSEGNFFLNILLGTVIMFGISVIVRFAVLKEHSVRNEMISMIDNDYKVGTDGFWGAYAVDSEYPYYVHLRNGKTALFVRFEKDVIIGRVSENEYKHYEAIGDAYNLAGSFNIGMCHIDYMDAIGNDDRLDKCFASLSDVSNVDMRDLLTDIYTNLQSAMDEMVTTYDVYVYTFKYSETTFWYNLQQVLACMMDANYASYSILNADEDRDLVKSLFNLHEFSVMDACSTTFGLYKKAGVIPISVEGVDGSYVKLNKTLEEKRLENAQSNKGKKANNTKVVDEVIDIFED